MGFFATTLGVGSYGAATIVLDRTEFVAGDVVAGRVRLSVTTRIDRAEPIRMDIRGRETLEYDETTTHRVTVQPQAGDDDVAPRTQEIKRVHREKLVYTILSDVIVLDVPARAYEPGVYEFPFDYQLPTRGLVPTFEFRTSSLGDFSDVRAHAEYELTVFVPINGMLKTDMRHTINPIIRPDPSLQVPCRVTESKTLPVYFFIFCLKGSCDLTATLEANVVPIGGVAQVEVLIENDSTQRVDRVTTSLHQVVTMNETRSSRDDHDHRDAPNITRKIASKSFNGVDAGDRLQATLAQPIAYDRKGSVRLMPTMRSHFLSFDYELTVRCRQAWCWEDPHATFPITLTTKSV